MCGDCNMYAQEIIRTHPHAQGNTNDVLIRCVEECYVCAQACTACADACLGEQMVQQLTQCVRLTQDCADDCAATGAVATRRTGSNAQLMGTRTQEERRVGTEFDSKCKRQWTK